MSFCSYAQNFEDVMLWRALKEVSDGFYIDIGAQDPVVDSVSLAFYERGWRGIHVEPTLQYSEKLRKARPDELVMQVAVGNQSGSMVFHEFRDTGLSTADSALAKSHVDSGYGYIETVVPVIALDKLLDNYQDKQIHWLKLDVEGLEKSVIESWKVSVVRPWILIIESTKPLSQEQSHFEWEPLLFLKGYQFVYFDGLNRYYISNEHQELASAFDAPPNIFDNFSLSGLASQPYCRIVLRDKFIALEQAQRSELKAIEAQAIAEEVKLRAVQAESRAEQAESMMCDLLKEMDKVNEDLNAIRNSKLWRITSPLRTFIHILNR